MRRLLTLAALLFVLPACGAPDAEVPAPATPLDPSLGPRPTAHRSGAPSTTLSPGQAVTDCGRFTLGPGETLPEAAARCFVDAASAGHRAWLQVTWPTVEGDPIPVTYASRDNGHTEVVTDSRADGFGPKTITTEDCQGPRPGRQGIEFARCTPVPK